MAVLLFFNLLGIHLYHCFSDGLSLGRKDTEHSDLVSVIVRFAVPALFLQLDTTD
jgi:hypothetical protein